MRPARTEPATRRFEARRSIQLTYWRPKVFQALSPRNCQGYVPETGKSSEMLQNSFCPFIDRTADRGDSQVRCLSCA